MKVQKSLFKGIIPRELLDRIKTGKCILFVGAGLSAQVKRSDNKPLPTWGQFLTELLDWAMANRINFWGTPEDIKEMIQKGNYLMAAQELQDRVGMAKLSEFLNVVFREKSVQPCEAHCLLPHIPFRAIMTLNYDSLIEGAYAIENQGRIPPVFTQEDLLTRHSLLREDEFFIFKMHGHLDRPSTVILGSRDYQDLLFRTPGYRQFLETLFSVFTILFVGFGGNDPDLDNIFDKLASIYSRTLDKHYIILQSGKTNLTEKRRLLFDKRLEVIEYHDSGHAQVIEFFKELIVQLNRDEKEIQPYSDNGKDGLKIFISGSMKDTDILIRISNFLKENGFSPWLAEREVAPGDSITQKISAAIQEADCVIVVFSKSSIISKWVEHELQTAMIRQLEKQISIIPIVIGDVPVPRYLQDVMYLKLDEQFKEGELLALIDSLSRIGSRKQKNKKK